MSPAAAAANPSGGPEVSPAPDTPAASAAGAGVLMSIGEVLAQLRDDFPDVTISKLRFLEAEGLVDPQRTAAGYRKYSRADVARLRFVLAAQRDRFLPLRVIRDHLAAYDRGEPGAIGQAAPLTDPAWGPRPSAGADDGVRGGLGRGVGAASADGRGVGGHAPLAGHGGEPRLSRGELLERSGLNDATLVELEATGLLRSRTPGWYDADALVIAMVAAQLAGYGLAPRHLRAYRAAADREVGLFTQLIAPLRHSSTPAAHARAAEALRELTALSEQLHAALVRIGLRETLGQ